MRGVLLAGLVASAAVATAAPAAETRSLTVPAGKGWQHAQTGLILRYTLLDLSRSGIVDSTADEHDVMVQFQNHTLATTATIYIFHPALDDVAVWFDRADHAAQHRPDFAGAGPVAPAPIAFAPPGSTVTGALRQLYVPNQLPYRSSAMAMLPLGEWMVAIRMSSTEMDTSALDTKLSELITQIGWPASVASPRPALPIAACAATTQFNKAKIRKPDMAQAMLGSLLAGIVAKGKAQAVSTPTGPWCRDGQPTDSYAVYRRGKDQGYTLALGDAGRTADVYPGVQPGQLPGAVGGYSVSVSDVDGSIATYPSFDKLPAPAQVLDLIKQGRSIARTASAGEKALNIDIDAAALD